MHRTNTKLALASVLLAVTSACVQPPSPVTTDELRSEIDLLLFVLEREGETTASMSLNFGDESNDLCAPLDDERLQGTFDGTAIDLSVLNGARASGWQHESDTCDVASGKTRLPTADVPTEGSIASIDNGTGPIDVHLPPLRPRGLELIGDLTALSPGDTLRARYLGDEVDLHEAGFAFFGDGSDTPTESEVWLSTGSGEATFDGVSVSVIVPPLPEGVASPVRVSAYLVEEVALQTCPFHSCKVLRSESVVAQASYAPAD